jgi:hypothetical protein
MGTSHQIDRKEIKTLVHSKYQRKWKKNKRKERKKGLKISSEKHKEE